MNSSFKERLLTFCLEIVQKKISNSENAILAAQQSANSDTKSSAGDKHETGRAMSQLDIEMNARQLLQLREEFHQLSLIKTGNLVTEVRLGALINCEKQYFFIAIGLGVVNFESLKIVVLSPQSPLASILIGKKIAEEFIFNKETLTIKELF